MAIVVEDGSKVDGANSYVSEAELADYATARNYSLDLDSDVLLIKAMDYLETLQFIGVKSTKAQPLQWPRSYAIIDTYAVDSNEIPKELKNAQMSLAICIDQGYDPLTTLTQGVKREKVDVVEVEYMDGSSAAPVIKSFNSAVAKLLANGGGGSVVGVYRG